MARAMRTGERREIVFFVVTDRQEGTTTAREKVRARDYSRKDSYYRGIQRAYNRLHKQYPKGRYSIQMHISLSEHPIAHLG